MFSASNKNRWGLYFYLIYTNSSLTPRVTPYDELTERREKKRVSVRTVAILKQKVTTGCSVHWWSVITDMFE
jgi:hypothetical protein